MVFGYPTPKLAAHISDYMMNTGLIRGNLNRKADGNPELEKKFLSVETLYLASYIDEEKVQTTNTNVVMKIIVVRNLFSFEYDGSNPSLPTIKTIAYAMVFIYIYLTKRK